MKMKKRLGVLAAAFTVLCAAGAEAYAEGQRDGFIPAGGGADYYSIPGDEVETINVDGRLLYDDGETVIYGSGEIYSVEPAERATECYFIPNDEIETVSPYSYGYAGGIQADRSASGTAVLGSARGIETYSWSIVINSVALSPTMFHLNQYDSVEFTFTAHTDNYYNVSVGLYDHDNRKFVPYHSLSGASGGKETSGSFTTTAAGNFSFAIRSNSGTADSFLGCSGAYSWHR